MQFALLFIVAFLIGLISYAASRRWQLSVAMPLLLYLGVILSQPALADLRSFLILFGVPLVFVGGLLGAYVLQIRRDEDGEDT